MSKAVDHLTRATELDGTSVAARAMLAVAYDLTGRSGEHMRIMDGLADLSADAPEDLLFLANAQLHRDTDQARKTLGRIPEEYDSALARFVRADVLAHHAVETGAMEAVEAALRDVQAARILMNAKDNGYLLGIDLWAHIVAIPLKAERGEPTEELMARADRIASDLQRYPQNSIWCLLRVMHYRYCRGDTETALSILQKAVRDGTEDYILASCASLLYETGRYDEAKEMLGREHARTDTPVAVGLAGVLATDSEYSDETLKELYEGLSATNRKYCFWTPETILVLVQDNDYVGAECERKLRTLGKEPWDVWGSSVIRFVAGKTSADAFVQEADNSRRRLCFAHYLAALRCLALRERSAGEMHFRECVKTGYYSQALDWAHAFLARLENEPNWPEKPTP